MTQLDRVKIDSIVANLQGHITTADAPHEAKMALITGLAAISMLVCDINRIADALEAIAMNTQGRP